MLAPLPPPLLQRVIGELGVMPRQLKQRYELLGPSGLRFALGFTATPARRDCAQVSEVFKHMTVAMTIIDALQQGLLAPVSCPSACVVAPVVARAGRAAYNLQGQLLLGAFRHAAAATCPQHAACHSAICSKPLRRVATASLTCRRGTRTRARPSPSP